MYDLDKMLLFGCVFLAFFLIFNALIFFMQKRSALNRRIKGLFPTQTETESVSLNTQFMQLVSWIADRIPHNFSVRFNSLLYDAGITMITAAQYVAIKLLVCTVIVIITLPFLSWKAILVSLLCYPLFDLYLKHLRKKRLSRVIPQLAQALGTMSNAMRSGFSFMQALQLVAEETPAPLGPEFAKTIEQISYGMRTEEAFQGLLKRVPNRELEIVITALLIQRSTGGNLASLLDTMLETIEGRIQIKQEVKTLTAQGRMSAWIIGLLPVFLLIILSFLNKEYFLPLFTEPAGWVLLGVGIIMEIVGVIVIKKIVNINVF